MFCGLFLFCFLPSPRGRLCVTFEESRGELMLGVRGGSSHMGWCPELDQPWGRCRGGFPAWDPRCEGPVGADPRGSWLLRSAGTCLSSKCKQKDKKQKHQQERSLTAKLCRNQMSFFIVFFHPGSAAYSTSLPLGEGMSPSQPKVWFRPYFSRGCSRFPGYGSVQPLMSMQQ